MSVLNNDILTAVRLLVDAPTDLSDADLAALDALRGDIGTRLREERERRDPTRGRLASMFRGYQPGWRAIAIPDGRRGLWIREHADERGILSKVEVCAGREGDDWLVQFTAGQPVDAQDLHALEDCLSTLRWVLETENNRAAPRDEERAGWDETLKAEGGRVVCAVCGESCWDERGTKCAGEAERRGRRSEVPPSECIPGVRCDATTGCVMAKRHEPPCRVEEAQPCGKCGRWPWETCDVQAPDR